MKFIAYVILCVLILSCGSVNNQYKYPRDSEVKRGASGITDQVQVANLAVNEVMDAERKVIVDIFLSLESDQPDSVLSAVQSLTKGCQGYIVNSQKNSLKIRIPVLISSDIVRKIEDLGDVKDKFISGQDVTEEYIDLAIRIDNIEKARQRYLELLARAEDVSAALKVEKELERLQREVDLLKGREQKLSHLTEYVTIDVKVNPAVRPGPLGYVFVGIYKVVKWLFIW
jgi:hypothetical protein